MRLPTICLSLVLLVVGALDANAQVPPLPSALENAERSTVRVISLFLDEYGNLTKVETGSGFVVATGGVITNAHVVADSEEVASRVFVIPDRRSGNQGVQAEVVDYSADYDLALLNVGNLQAPVLAVSEALPSKEASVHALGYPGVTDQIRNLSVEEILRPAEPYVTGGSIALLSDVAPGGRRAPTVFHTASVNPGNSGGPLVDDCGRVIGVNTWTAGTTVSSEGISVPSGQFIASRASSLLAFLKRMGITPTIDNANCVVTAPIDPVVEARLAAAEKALEDERSARAAREAEAKRIASRNELLLWLSLGAAATGGLAYAASRTRNRPSPQTAATDVDADLAEDKVAAPKMSKAPMEGSKNTALVVGLAVAAALLFGLAIGTYNSPAGEQAAPQNSSEDEGATTVALTCRSPEGALYAQFDARRACMNGRTAYEHQSDGYKRIIFDSRAPKLHVLALSNDLTQFSRSTYDVTPAAFRQLAQWRRSQAPLICPDGDRSESSSAVSAIRSAAVPYIQGEPVAVTNWVCTKSAATHTGESR